MLETLRRRSARKACADRLNRAISDRARLAVFYDELGVADTFDGRFDLVVLHAWLVLDALIGSGETELARSLIDRLFLQFDDALHELGVGDMGMGRRMRGMAEAFYGRLEAYRAAPDEKALAAAILRNLYRGEADRVESASRLATYCASARAHLAQSHPERGEADFGAPPG
jgi:cytochrome b pre-mRNA-processing protein 3